MEVSNLAHSSLNKYIRDLYDTLPWKIGETYRIRVGHIYDPSKFWVVVAEGELTIFQKFLNNFYGNNCEHYRIPPETVQCNMYCIAFSEGGYYRGIIVNIPILSSMETSAVVFLFDFGFITTVTLDNLFFLGEKLYEVPRFAIRACLIRLQPCDSDMWTSSVVGRFSELVAEKVLLCILESADSSNKTLYISIGNVNKNGQVTDIGSILLSEKLAKSVTSKMVKREITKHKFCPKTKYLFLFPTFSAIEWGVMPSCVRYLEMLRQCRCSQLLLKAYYNFQENNVSNNS